MIEEKVKEQMTELGVYSDAFWGDWSLCVINRKMRRFAKDISDVGIHAGLGGLTTHIEQHILDFNDPVFRTPAHKIPQVISWINIKDDWGVLKANIVYHDSLEYDYRVIAARISGTICYNKKYFCDADVRRLYRIARR